MADYLMAGQQSELERLQLQSRVWEPAGRALVERLPAGTGQRALDVGCGAMGWLRILGKWADPSGTVVGTDINRELLAAAEAFVAAEALSIVELVEDDLFASALHAGSFDLVHARFQLAPIGRAGEQLASYRRLVRPGGWLVLEEPDTASWHCLSHSTVKHHLANARSKVGAATTAQLVWILGPRLPEPEAMVRTDDSRSTDGLVAQASVLAAIGGQGRRS